MYFDHNATLKLDRARRSDLQREFRLAKGRTKLRDRLRSTMSGWDYKSLIKLEFDAPRPRFRFRKGY